MRVHRVPLRSHFLLRRTRCNSRYYSAVGVLLIALAAWVSGCKNREEARLSPSQVHAISNEMGRAASNVIGRSGNIGVRLQFDGNHPERSDHLFVTLPGSEAEQSRRESSAHLIQALDRIATYNHLTRSPNTNSGALVRLDYRRAGVLTHSIHIITPMATRAPQLSSAHPQTGTPRLAIILDDLGNDRTAADAIFTLPYPLTISVLPEHTHSVDIAEDAHRRGYQVMLHLPMQSVGNEKPEAQELRPGMSAGDVNALVEQFLQSVPNVVGINNHQGSQATADPALMTELMSMLRKGKLFYIDSRTTAATVGYDTAQHLGVRSAFRNVPFLDDVAEVSAVRKQLELAIRDAREKGEAIAIGHPHPATLQALSEVLPQVEAQGVRLVFASDLVH